MELDIMKQIKQLASLALEENPIILGDYIQNSYTDFVANKGMKPQNLKRYLGVLAIINSYPIAKKNMNTIDENDLTIFFSKLKIDRNLSKTSVNRYRAKLNSIFNHAIRSKIITYNPVRYTPKSKEYPRNRVLSEEEICRLMDCCKQSSNHELYMIVLVAIYTGMRYSNVVSMKKNSIHGQVYYLDGKETKSGKNQKIILNSQLFELLNDFMAKYDNGDSVFKCRHIKRSFNTALERAGINNFHFHDLRRTFATYLLDKGTNLKIIQEALGHSSIKMTEIYLAPNEQKSIDAIEALCFN